jgi:hypothetical protein
MTTEIARLVAAPRPSPLLKHLAGEAAEALAGVWPPPHAAYLAATSSRRHLIGMALAHGVTLDAASAVLEAPIRRAIALLLPDAPPGLKRALEKMGETGWPLVSYRRLLQLLHQPDAAKALRHAVALDPAEVDGVAGLPEPLLEAGLGRFRLSLEFAETAHDCFAAIVERDGHERAEALVLEWGRARSAEALFKRVEEDLLAEPVPAPFPATLKVRWLGTKAEIRDAARRYQNCLVDYLDHTASGQVVFGEWLEKPGAIVQLSRDPVFGWRLAEARGPGNEVLAEKVRDAVRTELGKIGVRVGRSGRDLKYAAQRGANGEVRPDHWEEDHDGVFGVAA